MNRNILKKTLSSIVFLAILLFLFCKITWLFRGNDIESREDIQGFKNQGKVDVVLVGGSTLIRFYNPLQAWQETGITSYNYATSGAKFDVLKSYIKDSRKTNKAELYVINVRTIALLTSVVDEPSIRNWSDSLDPMSLVRTQGITDFVLTRDWDAQKLPSFYFDIIKYHSNQEALSSEKQWLYVDLNNIYNIDKGFAPNKTSIPFTKKKWGEKRSKLGNQELKALNDILDYCDEEGIKALFICCPYIFSEADEGIINSCEDIIRGRGYDFENFNRSYDEMGLDYNTDFSDVNHLNYFGSIKYTHYLANYIANHYQLPDHRGEQEYSQWDTDYNTFMMAMKEIQADLSATINEHLAAKEQGEVLKEETDFSKWYSSIKNPNYTVIIRIDDIPRDLSADNPAYKFLSDYSIDLLQKTYIGIWNGDESVISSSEKLDVENNIGINGGRGRDKCQVSIENKVITIDGMEYIAKETPIQVVVYDNNYKEVIDNANIQITNDEPIILHRNERTTSMTVSIN